MSASSYGTPSSWLITRDGTGSASAVTMSPGCGPASIASMCSSVTCWITGRRPSTRLKVNGFDNIRRNRVCSSASEVKTDLGRLCTVDNMPSFQCGKPGRRSSTLTRESENSVRTSSYPVMSHGVLPSQILTLDSGRAAPSSIASGGGANGQPAALPIGYSGASGTASIAVPVRVSDTSHSSMSMASAGQPAAALRALSACSAGGFSFSRTTTPSSSRWSKSSGACITQLPDEAHLSWSTVTFIPFYSQLPLIVRGDRCQPESHDRVDQTGTGGLPRRTRHGCACGHCPFTLGTGVHQQVPGHQVAFHPNVDRQLGQAAVDPVDHLDQRFRCEGILDHDVVVGRIGHHLRGEPRVPGGVAEGC